MATNRQYPDGRYLTLNVGASKVSGDAVVVGNIAGVCVTDADDDGYAVIDRSGVYRLSVKGADNSGNKAVSVGDIIYMDSGTLNKDATDGIRFGYAYGTVNSGATTEIDVILGY